MTNRLKIFEIAIGELLHNIGKFIILILMDIHKASTH